MEGGGSPKAQGYPQVPPVTGSKQGQRAWSRQEVWAQKQFTRVELPLSAEEGFLSKCKG